ncbi:MAG: YihY/virulence factor BrkB family protein [Lachnoclostridium edouardi]|uniref:YihY/virulence factor BrkB family protein n=1 Tax=Lachnoclostridium edouardi TaxID=1926283 RepID=UPI0026DAC2B5|nr:YihY/virulence factor BrkB family protein [Lachnoclostridium edouardi]MDO4279174.1 YihY/virulence factor BrkB family protein [Lachnoclostridium edouardi]
MAELLFHIIKIKNKFVRDEMTVYAAQASFFIVLSFFPFIMVLMTLLQFIPNLSGDMVIAILMSIIPDIDKSRPFIENAISDLNIYSPETILWITIITALWSASKGMLSMERGLNRVWKSRGFRNYFLTRLICTGYTLVFMVMCIASLLLLVFGTAIQNFMIRQFPLLGELTKNILSLRTLLAIGILVVSFTSLYAIVPSRKLSMKQQIPGAVFSTVCWILFSYGFSIYFSHFSNFSYSYGSLTAIVLLMLWLYMCICILFAGAEINWYFSSMTLTEE